MESRERIFENAIDQLIQQALYELEQSDFQINDAGVKLSVLYDSLLYDETLDKSIQERVSFYIKETIEATNKEFRHIYLQGAKDCITALRTLGVIK